jgi:ADP-ribose pyrophosphatase YjhB (NUDIX family)
VAMLARGGAVDPAVALDVLGGDRGYATPKVDVRAFVVQAPNRVLLVREREDGRWTLPGGWADVTETPAEAAEREVREEAGYRVRATRLLACWDRTRQRGAVPIPYRAYKLVFLCEVLGEAARDDSETDAVDWFAPDELPPMSLGRSNPEQIVRLLELAADPALPADFH